MSTLDKVLCALGYAGGGAAFAATWASFVLGAVGIFTFLLGLMAIGGGR